MVCCDSVYVGSDCVTGAVYSVCGCVGCSAECVSGGAVSGDGSVYS